MSRQRKENMVGTVIDGKYVTTTIIRWGNSLDVDVVLSDGTICTHKQYANLENMKHPNATVNSIAYRGTFDNGEIPKVGENIYMKEETEWYNMINRCYDKNGNILTRNDGTVVTVCKEWLCLAQFVTDIRKMEYYQEWLDSKDNTVADGFHLDKDILCFLGCDTTKIVERQYSPTTCVFVPNKVNQYFKRVQFSFYGDKMTTVTINPTRNYSDNIVDYDTIQKVLNSSSLGTKEEREESKRQRALLLKRQYEETKKQEEYLFLKDKAESLRITMELVDERCRDLLQEQLVNTLSQMNTYY